MTMITSNLQRLELIETPVQLFQSLHGKPHTGRLLCISHRHDGGDDDLRDGDDDDCDGDDDDCDGDD